MASWRIRGGLPLYGQLRVQGSKNSVLPILSAALLARDPVVLENCPDLQDVDAALAILRHLGCRAEREKDVIRVDPRVLSQNSIPRELMGEMRSSVIFLGALLARLGEGHLTLPGGCDIGPRPIDMHLKAMEAMGASIRQQDAVLQCHARALHGAHIRLPYPSVGATENTMIAASLAKGDTLLENAAREPEIRDLAAFLEALGCHIEGAGTAVLHIRGMEDRENLREGEVTHRVIPDRIAAGTFLCAAAATGGSITLEGVQPETLHPVLFLLHQAGCDVMRRPDRLFLHGRPIRPIALETQPYPGFPTDLQAPMMAAMLRTPGESLFRESVFPKRFRHGPALRELGAQICLMPGGAVVRGVSRLHGASMEATDLRGGAAMVIGALCAEGESEITGLRHLARGYEDLPGQLRLLGADITVHP